MSGIREDTKRDSLGSLDFSILRERFRADSAALGFDPRASPELIAARLNVSPATVRRRLAVWRAGGFFLGYDVLPHPDLLGGRLIARVLDFPNAVAQGEAIRSASLIDGVIQIVPAQTMLMVVYLVDSEVQAQRRFQQLRTLRGLRELGEEMSFPFPPCERRMSRSDWRLVHALRRSPEAKISELATAVGQSPRTTSRRLDSIIEDGAVMFDPILDYARFFQTLAVLVAFVEAPESAERIEGEIRRMHPESAHVRGPRPVDPEGEIGTVELMVTARTAAELDDLAARVAHVPGVEQALLWHGRATLPVPDWLNERIEGIVREGQFPLPRPVAA
jgi:DNA-binding Lrp family transcriptional regulator